MYCSLYEPGSYYIYGLRNNKSDRTEKRERTEKTLNFKGEGSV